MPTRTVKTDKLVASQSDYDMDKIKSMAQSPSDKVPVVARMGKGKYQVLDGHHRVAADILNGSDKTKVRIVK